MLWISLFTVFAGTFTLAFAATAGAWFFVNRGQPATQSDEGPSLFKSETLSSIGVWNHLLARFDFVETLKSRLAQADIGWTVGRLTAMMLLVGTVTLVTLASREWMPFGLALLASVAVGLSPYFYVLRKRTQRFAELEAQLPDAMDFLARALRAGHPFAVSLEMLTQENDPPLSVEMRITADERRLGRSWEDAFRNLSRRVPSLNLRLFVGAVQMQTRTGGRLSEVLTQLAETMRESNGLRGEVRALAAHGRVTGAVLTFLPVAIAVMMWIVNPAYLRILLEDELGRYLIAAAIVALIAARIITGRIVDIKV
jgi:tight adherence protein B